VDVGLALVVTKRWTTAAELLDLLRRHRALQVIQVLRHALLRRRLHLELRLHQLQRRQEDDLQLGRPSARRAASARSDPAA
jgi:hypothetical protein